MSLTTFISFCRFDSSVYELALVVKMDFTFTSLLNHNRKLMNVL